MKLTDPRLDTIAENLKMKLSPVLAVAGLAIEGKSLPEIATRMKVDGSCIRPIFQQIESCLKADAAKRANRKAAAPRAKVLMFPEWKPSDTDIAFAKELGFDDVQIQNEIASFRHYWTTRKEARVWSLTWATWWRRRQADVGPALKNSAASDPNKVEMTAQKWKDAIETFRDTGAWFRSFGPDPESSGCRAPKMLLKEFGY